jgi:hypothetical protein
MKITPKKQNNYFRLSQEEAKQQFMIKPRWDVKISRVADKKGTAYSESEFDMDFFPCNFLSNQIPQKKCI